MTLGAFPRSWRSGALALWSPTDETDLAASSHSAVTAAALTARLPGAHLTPATFWTSDDAGLPRAAVVFGSLPSAQSDDDATARELVARGHAGPMLGSALRATDGVHPLAQATVREMAEAGHILSVADEVTRRTIIEAAGGPPPAVVPPPALLSAQVVTRATLAQRLAQLEATGAVPPRPLLVMDGALPGELASVAAAAITSVVDGAEWHVVVLPTARDGRRVPLWEAIAGRESGAASLVEGALFEDVAALIAGGLACVATDPAVAAIAAGLGRPAVWLDVRHDGAWYRETAALLGTPVCGARDLDHLPRRLDAAMHQRMEPTIVDGLVGRVEAHFDELADAVARAWGPTAAPSPILEARLERLQRAYDALAAQLHEERDLFATALRRYEADAALRAAPAIGAALTNASSAPATQRGHRGRLRRRRRQGEGG